MSTQQALGVIGGVVGSFFGYPQLGFVVGSLVGGLLTPKEKIEGPRVEDLKVQVSTYGAGIPVVYGNARVGGNVIWSTDKIETETTEDVGKGGGAESTTYRYFVHMRIRLCETPSDGSEVAIRKIWQDGKLIYDASFGLSIGSAIASAENPHAFLVLYQGWEDQLPDPIEEVFLGIGNVPAYRGGVDVRMNAVECPGGRVPQFSFEICVGSSLVSTMSLGDAFEIPADTVSSFPLHSKVGGVPITIFTEGVRTIAGKTHKRLNVYALGDNYLTPMGSHTVAISGTKASFGGAADIDAVCCAQYDVDGVNTDMLAIISADGSFRSLNPGAGFRAETDAMWGKWGDIVAVKEDPEGNGEVAVFSYETGYLIKRSTFPGVERVWVTKSYVWVMCTNLPASNYRMYVCEPESLNVLDYSDFVTAQISVSPQADDSLKFVTPDNKLWQIDAQAVVTFLHDTAGALGGNPKNPIRVKGKTITSWNGIPTAARIVYQQMDVVTPNQAQVAYIVADQCRRAGLNSEQCDIAEISDQLWGYTLANPASARSNLQPLMTAFAIDATEEDAKLKFFKRASKSSVATILYEELGTVEGDTEAGDPMPLTRAQDAELPRSVSASYVNKDFDYQTGTEKAIRQIFDSQNDMMVDLAMSTTSDHAATVAQAILYDSHNDRNKRSLKVSRKYAFLSAGDVVTVEYPATILSQWRIVKITDTGALIEIDCVPFDAAIYTQTAVGATGYAGQTVAPLAPPTKLQILDIPILRDQDNNAGIYAAMAGVGPGWPGASLQVGDDLDSLETRGTVEREAPQGFTESALGNWPFGIVDESNLLTVNVGHGLLESISYDALLTGAANVAAVGAPGRWEIIKFRTADSLGDGRFILSGMMRGQRGTEWARGTHEAGDVFVLLSMAGMLRPSFDAGSIGQAKTYRAVTKGRSPASASTQTYANTAEGLETFSPTNLSKSLSGGDITLSVVRRTRLSENWLRGIVPLGEDAERFEFELFTDNTFTTVRRVIFSSTRFATYTAAMQAADGYVSGPLYVRVYQLSGVVGRGRAIQETI